MTTAEHDALGVIVNDPAIAGWLAEHDPKALDQARRAFAGGERVPGDSLPTDADHGATRQAAWIDVMGAGPCYISAYFDAEHEQVLVTDDTLGVMIDAVRFSGLFDAETTEAMTDGLQQAPFFHGRRSVTEQGGGWAHWQQMLLEDK